MADPPQIPPYRADRLIQEYYAASKKTARDVEEIKANVQQIAKVQITLADGITEHGYRLDHLDSWKARAMSADEKIIDGLETLVLAEERRKGQASLIRALFMLGLPTLVALAGGIGWLILHTR